MHVRGSDRIFRPLDRLLRDAEIQPPRGPERERRGDDHRRGEHLGKFGRGLQTFREIQPVDTAIGGPRQITPEERHLAQHIEGANRTGQRRTTRARLR